MLDGVVPCVMSSVDCGRQTRSRIGRIDGVTMLKPRLELALSAVFATLALATALWPDWIERLSGIVLDADDGTAEWAIVGVLALLALIAGILAGRDYRTVLHSVRYGERS